MTDLTPRQNEILRHAIGIDSSGQIFAYRNHFVTGEGSDDFSDCIALAELGYFCRFPRHFACGGDDLFMATQIAFERYIQEYPR